MRVALREDDERDFLFRRKSSVDACPRLEK
jgi:hypothetical protein